MAKIQIKLSILGYFPYPVNWQKVRNWRSVLFEITDIAGPFSIVSKSNEDWVFDDETIEQEAPERGAEEILIIVTKVPIQDNYYVRRISDDRIILSYYEMADILMYDNIPLENLILRVLYSASFVYKRYGRRIPPVSEYTNFTHDETRGCIFDMNGIKTEIVFSLNKPKLCPSCVGDLMQIAGERISETTIKKVQEELKEIKKESYYIIMDWVRKHPYCTFIISSLFAIILGTIGSIIASAIYHP